MSNQLLRVCLLNVRVYVGHWFSCASAFQAYLNHLNFMMHLAMYTDGTVTQLAVRPTLHTVTLVGGFLRLRSD